ncbi:hypothetical protein SAMN06297421_106135 [Aristaeella hokkaidonensis]|nr:hypothetical protein SAMN06297421_106135 [Aristaeella hokkaidonensis]
MSVPQIMLIVLALAFAAWYLITSLAPEAAPYAQITAGVIGSRYTGDCLIVRDETPFDQEAVSSVEYLAEEGSYVSPGTDICNVYSSGFSTRELETLQDFRDQIKEYQVKLLNAEINTDPQMEKLEAEVLTRAREVRELIGGARGNMNNQEALLAAAIRARQSRLKEKYSGDQRMTRLYDDEQSQLQRIASWTKKSVALKEGLVSFYSDGYEYDLTITNYDKFSPAQVRAMINGQKPASSNDISSKGKTTIYRVVRDGHWVVLMLIKDSNWNPVEGAIYELKLENFKDTMVQAQVLSFTRTGGELEVRLDVQSKVQPVLYIRTCSGVLGDNVTSLTVPTKAIYTQDNMPGVVVVDGEYPFFIPVNVMDEKDGMVYISPIQQGTLYEGQTVKLF